MKTKNSEKLFEKSKNHIAGGVNSPVRAFKSVGGSPIFFRKSRGCYLYDEDGNKYLDLSENDRIRIFCDLAVERLLSDQKKSLERFGVEFDVWSSEKDIRESGAPEQIIQSFKDQNLLYESEGATWFKMTNFGDDKDTVVVKSDGEYTYFVPDAAYHQNKFNRGFHTLIDLLGPDHQGHISHLECLEKWQPKVFLIYLQY